VTGSEDQRIRGGFLGLRAEDVSSTISRNTPKHWKICKKSIGENGKQGGEFRYVKLRPFAGTKP
jgi:hypothetical protein